MTKTYLKQGDIIYIDFDPSNGSEIKKRRPALVISRDEYNYASNLVIVCPITSSKKERPYLVAIKTDFLSEDSKVNTKQLYTLDWTENGHRHPQLIGRVKAKDIVNIGQYVLNNFNFMR